MKKRLIENRHINITHQDVQSGFDDSCHVACALYARVRFAVDDRDNAGLGSGGDPVADIAQTSAFREHLRL